ncbi:MAG: HD domain-containing protein [Elusimicrobia bacterium]|nr:HD domain-containing protein [Elusimicrobiota bacterium]
MRISDIMKKKDGVATDTAAPASVEKETPTCSPPKGTKRAGHTDVVREIQQVESAEKVYGEAVSVARGIFSNIIEQTPPDITLCMNVVHKMIALHTANNEELVAMCEYSTPENYIYGHTANVTVMALLVGSGFNCSQDDLEKLGLCCLLHDLGMSKVLDVAAKKSHLSPSELVEIKHHPGYVEEILGNTTMGAELKNFVVRIISQVHERKHGGGYPAGLSGDDIHIFARIIAVSDVYEALTHNRAWRERCLPHEALKKMIEITDTDFDTDIVKYLIERLSLYPVGSYVKLNTDEIGRVVASNQGLPTRPKVKVLLSSDLKRAEQEKVIDLSRNTMTYIVDPVDETKLNLPDKKMALELKARRWWVKNT